MDLTWNTILDACITFGSIQVSGFCSSVMTELSRLTYQLCSQWRPFSALPHLDAYRTAILSVHVLQSQGHLRERAGFEVLCSAIIPIFLKAGQSTIKDMVRHWQMLAYHSLSFAWGSFWGRQSLLLSCPLPCLKEQNLSDCHKWCSIAKMTVQMARLLSIFKFKLKGRRRGTQRKWNGLQTTPYVPSPILLIFS